MAGENKTARVRVFVNQLNSRNKTGIQYSENKEIFEPGKT